MEGNWNGAQGNNKYQYNEKEWNDDFGLGWNDYGFRLYDPAISRWWSQDKMIEAYPSQSSYAFCFNNPFRYIDVDGNFIIDEKTAREYPEFAQFLADLPRIYQNKPDRFKQALRIFGQATDKQIQEWLTPGQGPLISEGFVDDGYGMTHKKTLKITIHRGLLLMYKNSSKYAKPCQAEVYKLLEATVFHELTHYGDFRDGKNTYSKGSNDGGFKFEKMAYGKIIEITNRSCIPDYKKVLIDYINSPDKNNNNHKKKAINNNETKEKNKDKPRA